MSTVADRMILLSTLAFGVFPLACQEDKPNLIPDAGSPASVMPDAATAACSVSTGPIDPTALIDNFEGGSSNLPQIGGRTGSWYADGDGTTNAILQPNGPAAPEVIPGGRCGSRHALHLTGAGFLDWGAQVEGTLNYGADDAGTYGEQPYNGSQYQGVTFFARIGDTSSTTVRFAISDEYARPEAGICSVGGGVGTGCYDTFGVDLSQFLTTSWQEFRIPFAGLVQRNFGVHSNALDTSKMYDIQFTVEPNVIFDFWIDDISFY
jgi:hypothetical protein